MNTVHGDFTENSLHSDFNTISVFGSLRPVKDSIFYHYTNPDIPIYSLAWQQQIYICCFYELTGYFCNVCNGGRPVGVCLAGRNNPNVFLGCP